METPFICTNPKHSHGSHCYRTCRCKCAICRGYNNSYRKRYQREYNILTGKDVYITSAPSSRRLQALACMGWSPGALGERYGVDRRTVESIRRGDRPNVRRKTHRLIERMYLELSMVPAVGKSARQARFHARKNKWPSPMELGREDINAPWGEDRSVA